MNQVAIDLIAINKATRFAAETAVAEIVFDHLSEEMQSRLGRTNFFNEPISKVDIVTSAVREAQKAGEPYRYGTTAKHFFALPENAA